MGYYTNFDIETDAGEDTKASIIARITELLDGYDPFEGECKWYDHKEHCIEVSKEFPDVTITISGEGEQVGDQWRDFFIGGRVQEHRAPKWVPPDEPNYRPWSLG